MWVILMCGSVQFMHPESLTNRGCIHEGYCSLDSIGSLTGSGERTTSPFMNGCFYFVRAYIHCTRHSIPCQFISFLLRINIKRA